MSCSYYTWKSGYYCLKKEADVDEDMYYKTAVIMIMRTAPDIKTVDRPGAM